MGLATETILKKLENNLRKTPNGRLHVLVKTRSDLLVVKITVFGS